MRLLADENIPAPLVYELRDDGFDVAYVAEMGPGLTDLEVLELSLTEERPLLTEDRDFGELVFRRLHKVYGIVLLRIPVGERRHWPRVRDVLSRFCDRLAHAYFVIGRHHVRIRPLP